MITINIIWIILFISLVLISLGLYFQKKALLLVLFGGTILLISGITTLTDPITFVNQTHTHNIYSDNFSDETHWDADSPPPAAGTVYLFHTQEVPNNVPINNSINLILGWTMMLLGLALIIGSSINLYDSRFDEEEKIFEE